MDTQRLTKNLTKDVPPIAPDAFAKRISIDARRPVVTVLVLARSPLHSGDGSSNTNRLMRAMMVIPFQWATIVFDADPLEAPFAPFFELPLAYGARLSNGGNVSKHVVSRLIVHLGLEGILILEGVCSGRRGPSIDQVEPTLKMRH